MEKSCGDCDAKCCKHVAVEIDTPEEVEEFEDIKWFVSHKNVSVFIDEDKKWYLEFLTPCEFLNKDNKCTNYESRPKICREYSHKECVFQEDYEEEFTFKNLKDVEKYIEEVYNKGKHFIPTDDN